MSYVNWKENVCNWPSLFIAIHIYACLLYVCFTWLVSWNELLEILTSQAEYNFLLVRLTSQLVKKTSQSEPSCSLSSPSFNVVTPDTGATSLVRYSSKLREIHNVFGTTHDVVRIVYPKVEHKDWQKERNQGLPIQINMELFWESWMQRSLQRDDVYICNVSLEFTWQRWKA